MARPVTAVFDRRPPPDQAPSYPDWVLLDTVVRGANYDWEKISIDQCSASMATTARTLVDVRREAEVEGEVVVEVEVSFLFVEPPQVSGFIVHVGDHGLGSGASVGSTDADAVLLSIMLASYKLRRYFVYKACEGNPTLEALPHPPPMRFHPTQVVGILSHGQDYAVAAMIPKHIGTDLKYELFLYSSQTKIWSTKVIQLNSDDPSELALAYWHTTTKVITVGADSLGWVDLSRGILVCNVLDSSPLLSFLKLPRPSRRNAGNDALTSSPRAFRDVICIGDTLKFVEVDYNKGNYGWKATTKKKNITSGDSEWDICFTVRTGGIRLTDRSWDLLSHRLWDDNDAQQLSLRKFECSTPTLGLNDDDNIYMMSLSVGSKEKPLGLFAALDMGNKDIRLVSYSTERMTYGPNYRTCAVSWYFKNTSGKSNIIGESLMSIGLVKLQVLKGILTAIQTLMSLADKLKSLGRPKKVQLGICSDSVAMLGLMETAITSYTGYVCTSSVKHDVAVLQDSIRQLGSETSPLIETEEYKMVSSMQNKISHVIALARSLVKELLPKRLGDPCYSLQSVERTPDLKVLPLILNSKR